MTKKTQITKDDFEALLNWLSNDDEEAANEYEKIRGGLVRYFRYKGCSYCDELADETINRVARKIEQLDLSTGSKKSTICYGFAYNVFREYLRDNENKNVQIENETTIEDKSKKYEVSVEKDFDCLEKCLSKLDIKQKELLTTYFSKEKSEKIILRKKIADELGITPNALHVRVYRIKNIVKKCIEKCNE